MIDDTKLEDGLNTNHLYQALQETEQQNIPILAISERFKLDDQQGYSTIIMLHTYLLYVHYLNALEYLYATFPTPYVQHWYRQRTVWNNDQDAPPQILLMGKSNITDAYAVGLKNWPCRIKASSDIDDAKFFIIWHLPQIVVLDDTDLPDDDKLADNTYTYLRLDLQTGIPFILISNRYTQQDVRALDIKLFAPEERYAMLKTLQVYLKSGAWED